MHLVPGIVMLIAASGALYKTVEVWPKALYDASVGKTKSTKSKTATKTKSTEPSEPGAFGAQMAASTGAFGGGSNPY